MTAQATVFLSHTTRDNRDRNLAHKLAVGLQARGARVWIAPESIPTGEKWEEHIVFGILEQCTHFLVILSAASTTATWVLDEIKLARKRREQDADFKFLPLIVGKVGTYANSNFIDKLQRVPYHDDFHAQLEAVAQAVGLRPTVPDTIHAIITEKTRDFVGREYVFEAIDAFLEEHPNGYFIIEGDPGIGKTAILARWVQRTGCIAHFNVRAQGINSAWQFLKSVCAQIIARFGLPYASLPAGATRDGAFLVSLLNEASDQLEEGERLIIAVDALDEVDLTKHTGNILYLPAVLPNKVYFVVTRRQTPLPLTINVAQELFDLMQYRDEGLHDVQTYIRERTVSRPKLQAWIDEQGLEAASFVTALGQKSGGNFMYVRYLLPEIENGVYADLNIHNLPVGLEGYYEDHWRRMGMMARPLPRVKIRVVYVLSVAQRPISRSLIAQFANDETMQVDEVMVQEVLDEWDEFLHEKKENGTTLYSVYHASFRDFLHRKDIVQAAGVTIQDIHGLIADNLWENLFDGA